MKSVIEEHVKEGLENQLQVESPVTWEAYDKTLLRSAYKMVHFDPMILSCE